MKIGHLHTHKTETDVTCSNLNVTSADLCVFCLTDCCLDYPGAEEYKLWKGLPVSWSVPVPGQTCKMTELCCSDPEFMEVQCNVRRTSCGSFHIASVSNIRELLFLFIMFVVVISYNNNIRTRYGRTLSDASMLYFADVFFIGFLFFFMAALVGQTAERIFTKLSHMVDISCYL